jgi:hypothetical protein
MPDAMSGRPIFYFDGTATHELVLGSEHGSGATNGDGHHWHTGGGRGHEGAEVEAPLARYSR